MGADVAHPDPCYPPALAQHEAGLLPMPYYNSTVQRIELERVGLAVNGSYTGRQLFTDVPWYRCELVPDRCATDGVKYHLEVT